MYAVMGNGVSIISLIPIHNLSLLALFFLPIRLLSMMPHYDGKDLTKCLSKVGSYQHLLIYFTVMENHKWSNRWLPFKLLILIAVCFFSSNLAT